MTQNELAKCWGVSQHSHIFGRNFCKGVTHERPTTRKIVHVFAHDDNALKLQRIQQIETYLRQHGSVRLDDLCRQFDVSKNTIRRDIEDLEARQIIKKVYGGVVLNDEAAPIPLSKREATLASEKALIAAAAANFVQDGDIIALDAGSTTMRVIDYLRDKRRVTVITNSVPVITAAAGQNHLHIIVTGGDVLRSTNSLVGQDAIAMLKKLNAHTAFIAATSVSLEKGVTNSSLIETDVKKAMMEISARRILLIDHTKFNTVSLVKFAEISDFHVIITDAAPPQEYADFCRARGVTLVAADAESENDVA